MTTKTYTVSRIYRDHDKVEILQTGLTLEEAQAICRDPETSSRVPEHFKGYRVIDGDAHDLRFLDPKGVVVGLKAKGAARRDTSGFMVKGEL